MPRAEFVEYDAASPAPRNTCTKNTRQAILDTLQVWASDNMATKVYWLNGMAGTGKTTIAYSVKSLMKPDPLLVPSSLPISVLIPVMLVVLFPPSVFSWLSVGIFPLSPISYWMQWKPILTANLGGLPNNS